MTTVRFKFTTERINQHLNLGSLCMCQLASEGKKIDFVTLRDLLANFVVDSAGNFLPHPEAVAVVSGLSVPELTQVTEQMNQAFSKSNTSAGAARKGLFRRR